MVQSAALEDGTGAVLSPRVSEATPNKRRAVEF